MTTSKVIPLHRVTQVPYTVDGPHTKPRVNWWGAFTLAIIPASFLAACVAVYWGGRALGAW